MSRSYTSSSPWRLNGVAGQHLLYRSCTKIYLNSKAKQSRYTPWWRLRGEESYSFLTSALDGGEWSASRPGRALLGGMTPGTYCTGGWVGPRAGLDKRG
jgi:hypothetical protein